MLINTMIVILVNTSINNTKITLHLMMINLCLQLLDVAGVHRLVLNDPVSIFNHALQVSHFLFILFVLHHCLLKQISHTFIFIS